MSYSLRLAVTATVSGRVRQTIFLAGFPPQLTDRISEALVGPAKPDAGDPDRGWSLTGSADLDRGLSLTDSADPDRGWSLMGSAQGCPPPGASSTEEADGTMLGICA